MPKLIRFLIINTAFGVLIGWLIAAAVLYFNINGFGDLVNHSRSRLVAYFILFNSFGVTFGFAVMASAVMLMPHDKDEFDKL
ncbi:MAG: hypothetical protein CML31_11575 [Rhizobiales bacterium]|mgnify:FL=1|nr:hypothetical protein [Hoeflea sp.]MBG20573.1 hypothetical protein [Hyphomicrobiales bacterium]|tara:strand:- start:3996 stop:4241 length:246 start_codon:yes stop_codon:yes gene_type:complete